jgi:hypothetical protein
VLDRITKGIMPNNRTDAVTLLHDIDYLRFSGLQRSDVLDDRAIAAADYSLPGMVTKAGLTLRKFSGLNFDTPVDGLTAQQTRTLGEKLFAYVKLNPKYNAMFRKYGLNPFTYS